jgi:hypothetical protein
MENLSNMMISSLIPGYAMADREWQDRVKGILKAELKRRNVGYRELAEKLSTMGIPETEANIANKISRGGFTAVFFVQCLLAVGCSSVRLEDG